MNVAGIYATSGTGQPESGVSFIATRGAAHVAERVAFGPYAATHVVKVLGDMEAQDAVTYMV